MKLDFQPKRIEPAHVQIEAYLRSQIEDGALPPGTRLPTNAELAQQWGVSSRDVQKAMTRLAAMDQIERAPRRGTFVRAATEKAFVGVLFGPSLAHETAYHYRELWQELRQALLPRKWVGRFYDGLTRIEGAEELYREGAVHNLTRDIRQYRFKGLILFSPEMSWLKTIEEDLAQLPDVCMSHPNKKTDFFLDYEQFGRDSVAYLAGQGRKRMAMMHLAAPPGAADPDLDGMWDEARAQGLSRVEVVQLLEILHRPGAEERIYQKMREQIGRWRTRPEGLPDGLIVNDDVAMRAVALALLAEGVRVPEEMRVVTLASEGVNLHYGLPIVRYEFPLRGMVHQMVDLLWQRMTRQTLPRRPISIRGRIQENEFETAHAVSP
ncbi:MAG: GntR family transcriptional regulator [Verrucomicrobiae bacterium]|nr:GntR family transcriptional regulator [Verrucomicrobiae bacterium]